MPLIVEDGSGLSDSNSYVTVSEADDYFLNHPYYADNWSGLTNKESFLEAASAQLDALVVWKGFLVYGTQAMGWPRNGVIDDEGRIIPADVVPDRVKKAVFELAFHLSRGDPYAASSSEGIDRLKIDVIELQFSGSTTTRPVPAATLLYLKGLVESTFGSRVRKVLVG